MNTGMGITIYLSSALVAGVLAGAVASAKRRHQAYWTVSCFLLPPLVLVLLLLPRGHTTYTPREPMDDSLD